MSQIFEKFAKPRELYPTDIDRIAADEARVAALLKVKEYAAHEGTQELIDLCRKDVLFARKRLATDRSLTEDARRELWGIIDARQWVLEIVARDFEAELARIESELEAEPSQ